MLTAGCNIFHAAVLGNIHFSKEKNSCVEFLCKARFSHGAHKLGKGLHSADFADNSDAIYEQLPIKSLKCGPAKTR